ncbi:hypothetical protein DOM22_16960 [Bdellovibrio sp. ZAP7]|uniref:hypothetical protein n=1 Tax=Bdellovibrio sp. ZAP7 TaxID=2231053 RepID=UPI001158BB7F|nr:hypothetical protein [Bdellovibrio sp. ZAP7]QDK46723.1 hypothetical protein DOM22_16960 [Bdellovibrio sp. ZAP7]
MITESLLGLWIFSSLIYQGQEVPRPNPALQIEYEFSSDGTNSLRYHRDGEPGFCERRALYQFSEETLMQEVVWINPSNADWCTQDSDMQLGRKTRSHIWFKNGRLFLDIEMGDEIISYIWERK